MADLTAAVRVWWDGTNVVLAHSCTDGLVEGPLPNGSWRLVGDPSDLTVEPSVACDRCGLHGWITQGQFWTTGGPR